MDWMILVTLKYYSLFLGQINSVKTEEPIKVCDIVYVKTKGITATILMNPFRFSADRPFIEKLRVDVYRYIAYVYFFF